MSRSAMVVRSVAVWSDEGMAERNETRIFSYTLGGGGGGNLAGGLRMASHASTETPSATERALTGLCQLYQCVTWNGEA